MSPANILMKVVLPQPVDRDGKMEERKGDGGEGMEEGWREKERERGRGERKEGEGGEGRKRKR